MNEYMLETQLPVPPTIDPPSELGATILQNPPTTDEHEESALFWNPPPINDIIPALYNTGPELKQHNARDQVPCVVLFPAPPTTTAPKARHPQVAFRAMLQLPPPTND
jgi:hypothetical protein